MDGGAFNFLVKLSPGWYNYPMVYMLGDVKGNEDCEERLDQ